jgi:hypothetical protein
MIQIDSTKRANCQLRLRVQVRVLLLPLLIPTATPAANNISRLAAGRMVSCRPKLRYRPREGNRHPDEHSKAYSLVRSAD